MIGKKAWSRLKPGHGKRSTPVFLQSGRVAVFRNNGRAECEPWIMKALSMKSQDADSIIEALLRKMPIRIDNVSFWRKVTEMVAHEIMLQYGADRYSANLKGLVWLFNFVFGFLPLKVNAHYEPCWCHGSCLGQNMSTGSKEVTTTMTSPVSTRSDPG